VPARPTPPVETPDVSTQGGTTSTAFDSGGTLAETVTSKTNETGDPEPVVGPPNNGPPSDVPVKVADDAAPPARVSLVTLHNGVIHRQRATGVDLLQSALGLDPTGYPDDALDVAIANYRRDNGLGGGGVDLALLIHFGFDVVVN
jgi:hypothetical protein